MGRLFLFLSCAIMTAAASHADVGVTHIQNPYDLAEFLPTQRKALSDNIYLIIDLGLNGDEPYDLSDIKNGGTAFWGQLPGWKSPHLVTARHNLVTQIPEHENKIGQKIQFLLVDSQGKVAYDSRANGQGAQLAFMAATGEEKAIELTKKLPVKKDLLDVVVLKLEHPLSTAALPISTQTVAAGERIYLSGYPTKTQTRFEQYKKNDSDGKSLFVSAGWTTSPAHAWHILYEQLMPADLNAVMKRYYLNIDTEGIGGFSGAPVIDMQGQVVGLFIGSMARKPEEKYETFSSLSLRASWINELITAYGVSL